MWTPSTRAQPVVKCPGRLKGGGKSLNRQRHGSRGKSGDAVPGKEGRHHLQAVLAPVGKIRPGAAVGMEIHQPGNHLRALQIDIAFREPRNNFREDAVLHPEAAGKPAVRRKYYCAAKYHDF